MRTYVKRQKTSELTKSGKSTGAGQPRNPSRAADEFLHLQRTIGNRAVQRLVQSHAADRQAGYDSAAFPSFRETSCFRASAPDAHPRR